MLCGCLLASAFPLCGQGVCEDGQPHKAEDVDIGDQEQVVGGYEGVGLRHDALQHKLQDCKQTFTMAHSNSPCCDAFSNLRELDFVHQSKVEAANATKGEAECTHR